MVSGENEDNLRPKCERTYVYVQTRSQAGHDAWENWCTNHDYFKERQGYFFFASSHHNKTYYYTYERRCIQRERQPLSRTSWLTGWSNSLVAKGKNTVLMVCKEKTFANFIQWC